MSRVLIGIIIVAIIVIWLGLSFFFEPIGKAVSNFFRDLFK